MIVHISYISKKKKILMHMLSMLLTCSRPPCNIILLSIMSFILNRTDAELKYKVIDRAGSPYAELILMSDSADTLQPYINWADGLLIDNTNSLTFICTKGNFMQQPGMESRNMQISQSLKAGQSETICFFKSDVNENYTMSETIVKPDAENRYIIQVGMN